MPAPAPPRSRRHAPPPVRLRSIHAAVRLMNVLDHAPLDPLARKRRLVADLCRILGQRLRDGDLNGNGNGHAPPDPTPDAPAPAVALSPRMRQTLERLLAGDSEKQIAARLRLSPHTVHVYVKTLYRRFDVCSRGELFSRFIRPTAAHQPRA